MPSKSKKQVELVHQDEGFEKSNYGPKGTAAGAQYSPHENQERKANNTGDVAGQGPNRNVKSYSSKPGQLSAKQQAAREMTPARIKKLSGPVTKPVLTEEEKARYLANMKKDEILEVTPDGKRELVEGRESLKKDPKKKAKMAVLPDGSGFFTGTVGVKKRWKALKKALDHKKAFMDLEDEMGENEEQPQEDQSQGDAGAQQQQEAAPEEATEQTPPPGQPAQDESAESPPEAVSEGQEENREPPDPQELMDALKEEGYSDQEIAYIVHGHHAAEVDPTKAAKAQATNAMSDIDIDNAKRQAELEHSHNEQSLAAEREHKQKMRQLELEQAQKKHALMDQEAAHKQRLADNEFQQAQQNNPQALEQEHKKRMLDLEYEKAKKESSHSDDSEGDAEANKQMKQLEVEKKKLELNLRKEEIKLELEFKKREQELKLKIMEQQLKDQAKQKSEIGDIKHEQKLTDAKNPPKKSLKKSEE